MKAIRIKEYVDAYVQAIKEAGNLWGVPVIDFNSVTGMNPMIEEQLIYFYDSGVYLLSQSQTASNERTVHRLINYFLSLHHSDSWTFIFFFFSFSLCFFGSPSLFRCEL